MAEFSSRAMLDVAVSESSLSSARDQVESELGSSVRSSIDMTTSGGRRGGRSSIRDVLVGQTELLVQIRDAIEESAFASSRGGRNTIIGGLGVGAAGVAAAGSGAAALGTRGVLNLAESLGLTRSDVARDRRQVDTSDPLSTAVDLAGDTILNMIDPAGIGESILRTFVERARSDFPNVMRQAATAAASSLRTTLDPLGIGESMASGLATDLSSFQLNEPDWLSNLTTLQIREPEWVRELTRVLGGGGGGGGGRDRRDATPAGLPGTRSFEVNVQGRGLERTFQNALQAAIETRDFERFVTEIVASELRGR